MGNRKNDISLTLTGSKEEVKNQETETPETKEENNPDNPLHDFDIDQVNKIMTDIFKLAESELKTNESFEPNYVLKADSDGAWLYSMTRRAFFKMSDNIQITAVDVVSDDISYCVINHDVYEVKNDMILCVGWN